MTTAGHPKKHSSDGDGSESLADRIIAVRGAAGNTQYLVDWTPSWVEECDVGEHWIGVKGTVTCKRASQINIALLSGAGLVQDFKRTSRGKLPINWPTNVQYTDSLVLNPKLFKALKSGHDLTPCVHIRKLSEAHAACGDDSTRGLFAGAQFVQGQLIGHYTGLVSPSEPVCVVLLCVVSL